MDELTAVDNLVELWREQLNSVPAKGKNLTVDECYFYAEILIEMQTAMVSTLQSSHHQEAISILVVCRSFGPVADKVLENLREHIFHSSPRTVTRVRFTHRELSQRATEIRRLLLKRALS